VTGAEGSIPAYGAAARGDWPLDPATTYLNHGGYGVTPNRVLAEQAEWRVRIERNPMRFLARELAPLLPVAALVRLARAAGALVLVDGAHAPGQVPLDLPAIAADWYVGNCHKWLLAPRGCGFLWANKGAQDLIHPLAISHGYGAGFLAEFDWTGTRDPSALQSVPAAIACHEAFGGASLMARNALLAREAAQMLRARWGTELIGPEGCFAAMAAVRLPLADDATIERACAIEQMLADEHRIEIAVMAQAGGLWVRLAAQAYNEIADYERLAAIF
jgi:isopenicillin-N epimerase